MIASPANWFAGWTLILLGFLAGAAIGIRFHREDFLGGYVSLRRRMLRLGHIALVALGMVNVLYAFAPSTSTPIASILFISGSIAMPLVCFLCAWRPHWRGLFPIPVIALISAVVLTLARGVS